jgi:hypothetical protein
LHVPLGQKILGTLGASGFGFALAFPSPLEPFPLESGFAVSSWPLPLDEPFESLVGLGFGFAFGLALAAAAVSAASPPSPVCNITFLRLCLCLSLCLQRCSDCLCQSNIEHEMCALNPLSYRYSPASSELLTLSTAMCTESVLMVASQEESN